MLGNNLSSHGLGSYQCHICYTKCNCCDACLYASNPMTHWYNNVLSDSTNLLTYQGVPQNPISGFPHVNYTVRPLFHVDNDQEAIEQMATTYNNEIDSWLLLNSDHGEGQNNLPSHQIDGCLNLRNYSPWIENQYQGQFNKLQPLGNDGMLPFQSSREGLAEQQEEHILKSYQGIQHDFSRAAFHHNPAHSLSASVLPTSDGIVPEATIGSMSNMVGLPTEWELGQFSLPLVDSGNIIDATVGSYSKSNGMSSEETTQLISREKSSESPRMSRQERVLRYLKKKKARKYVKKIRYSSRKLYAQTRPRIRGRFARRFQTAVQWHVSIRKYRRSSGTL